MFTLKINTGNVERQLKKIHTNVNSTIKESGKRTLKIIHAENVPRFAPIKKDVLRNTLLYESKDFIEKDGALVQRIIYDTEPMTGEIYAYRRLWETTTGVPGWAIIGAERATPKLKEELTNAVRRGIKK